jgi:SulP family sulfate permease
MEKEDDDENASFTNGGISSLLSRSVETGGRFLKREYDEKWDVVSPMTHHVIMDRTSPPRTLRRRRSRSFNDYIDTVPDEHSFLLIPPIDDPVHESFPRPKSPSSTATPTETTDEHTGNPAWICILYGLINATIVLPVVTSFGNIIYQNEAFQPYMPVLIKLTLISGVVHQICFSSLSSLKFVVGSVQDAGLIFLSAMATDIVNFCRSRGLDDEEMLATVTICLGIAAAFLGFGLIIIGRLRLAGYVQLLPTCVIAGYLAYIGFFCGKSGVALMAGTQLTLPVLIDKFMFIVPGIAGGFFIYFSVRTLKHVAVLPMTIIILLLLFYGSLVVSGSSIAQATRDGWIREAEPAPVWYRSWDYLQFDKVAWSVLPRLLVREFSMIFVVALSSSLDVAAIELEMKSPLDYNKELTMVGISNVISGLTGGYTGSYIFSQSIFTLRAGIQERLSGFVLAFCEISVIVMPFPVLSYVPNFFYGSLLAMICIDLMYEWLWDFRDKVTTAEYIIALSTFCLIQVLQVEYGILAGVFLYVLCRQLGVDVGEVNMATTEAEDTAPSSDQDTSTGLTR